MSYSYRAWLVGLVLLAFTAVISAFSGTALRPCTPLGASKLAYRENGSVLRVVDSKDRGVRGSAATGWIEKERRRQAKKAVANLVEGKAKADPALNEVAQAKNYLSLLLAETACTPIRGGKLEGTQDSGRKGFVRGGFLIVLASLIASGVVGSSKAADED